MIKTITDNSYKLRLLVLLIILVSVYLVAQHSGILQKTDPQQIKLLIQQWGTLGIALYILLFSLGLLVYMPGTLFLVSSGLIYGPLWGSLIAWIGACIAVSVSFFAVRIIGGKPFKQFNNQRLQKVIDRLHTQPIKSIAILRTIMITAPGFNYFLALSNITFRQYFLGSLIGMITPVVLIVTFTEKVITLLF